MNEELYRDLAKHDNLEDLYKQYYAADKEVETAKGRRNFAVFAGTLLLDLVTIVIILRPFNAQGLSDIFWAWFSCLLFALGVAGFRFWLSFSAYSWMTTKNREDHDRRERLKTRIKYAKEYLEQKAGEKDAL